MVGVAQIILENPWVLLPLLLAWLLFVIFAWRRRFRPFGAFLLRLAILVLVTGALTRPVFLPPEVHSAQPEERLVLLVDQSASLGEAGQVALREEATRLTAVSQNSTTLFFGDRPVLVPAGVNDQSSAELPFNSEQTNLASALSAGAEILNGQPGRLVLLSDGVPTNGGILDATARLAEQGIPVDVLILTDGQIERWSGSSNEVRLVNLDLPPTLRQGETFDIEVEVHSTALTEATLRLTRPLDGTVLGESVELLEPGLNLFTFETEAEELGPQTYRASIAADEDGQPANNSWSALTQVYPPPQILIVGDQIFPSARFANQLEQAGFTTGRMLSKDLPDRLSELEPYAGMVLLNVPARELRLEQMIAVQEFVRSLGRGLLVTGGRDSYSLGGYENTPLADLLPVSLDPPPREERPPVALLLIIDHSGSMVETRTDRASKLAMAKEAAIRATDILGPQDLIGVLMFDNRYEWVVPFRPVSEGADLLEIEQAIATIPGGGGTRILQALEVGLPALAEQDVASAARHAVLLTDGKSFDGDQGLEDYNLVVDAAQEADITLSTIAIGSGADEALLMQLAEWGRGRYHFAEVPDELPELTIEESDILQSNAVQEGEFQASIFKPHPMLRGLFMAEESGTDQMPELAGYIALTPKPRAEIALQAGPGDPLLSVWGYGLGRVAAWASDNGQEWAADLSAWPDEARFWGQVVDYTLPGPELGLLQLQAEIEPDGVVTFTADGVTATGQTADLAPTEATLISPAGRETTLNLRQVAPGRYQQRLRLPDPGAYQVSVTQARDDDSIETAITGFVIPYPSEYALPPTDDSAGQTLLAQIATTTGGHTFSLGESLPGMQNSQSQIEDLKSKIELWPWLLLAALMLWPLEIAWRRWGRLRIQ